MSELCAPGATRHANSESPTGEAARNQRVWDSVLAEKSHSTLLSNANQRDHARLLSATAPESGSWLHAVPSANLGSLQDPETLRIAVALRVGADVCQPHQCRCGARADSRGHHALTCRLSAERHPRHTALNDVVKRALQTAGIPSILEPTGIDRGDGKRPDGMTVFPFAEGKSLVWDATCVNTFAASHLASTAVSTGAAAKDAEIRKNHKYASLASRFMFQPVAFETGGACGPSTKLFLRQLGARVAASTGDRREQEWLWQRLYLAVIRGNATSVLMTTAGKDHCFAVQHTSRGENSFKQSEHCRERHTSVIMPLPSSDTLLDLLDLDGPVSPPQGHRSRAGFNLLQEYRSLFDEMQAEVAELKDRDPMADPDLARYLRQPSTGLAGPDVGK